MKSGSLDQWREHFRAVNSDIFEIIDHAIMVAASDCPKEFRLRRDRIAERLFSCRLTLCSGCNRVELAVPASHEGDCNSDGDGGSGDGDEEDEEIDILGGFEFEVGTSKESKVNSSNNRDDDNGEVNVNEHDQLASNYSYGEAEALTDEIEEETQIMGEVFRIKSILQNSKDESDSVLFESLRRLQLMSLTVDMLKATEIGKAVNCLRKHGSQQIRHLARTLIDGWKVLVDEWYSATKSIRVDKGTPDSVNPSDIVDEEEEEGLPSPPLDEGAFFATQPTSMELAGFFDGMDDDGNPRNNGEFIKNRENGRKPSLENQTVVRRKQQNLNEASFHPRDNKSQQIKRQDLLVKPSKPLNNGSGPGRPPRQNAEQKANNESNLQRKTDKIPSQRKPLISQQNKLKCSNEVDVQMKLEATKRKLQESYQQAENAKRQRTIQVMELHDLPKQSLVNRNPHMRPGNHNRHWGHGRR